MAQQTYRAVFLDLDGTLLPMEISDFLPSYFHALGAYLSRFGVDSDAFMAGMNTGIKNMTKHVDGLPNSNAFWDGFFAHVDKDACDWDTELASFYEHEFGKLGAEVVANPAARRAVETLVSKGYPLVLATMPMYPRRAVEWRTTWAGVDPAHFERITTFDNSTSVKPKPEFYAENLAACGLSGEDILMVGNNTVDDIAPAAFGIDTFLVTDTLLNSNDLDLASYRCGTLAEFADWVETLPACENPATNIDDGLIDASACAQVLGEIGA